MSLSPTKREILETLLLNDKPMNAMDIAKETSKEFEAIRMQILGLAKMKYVRVPEKGLWIITQKGKEALGVPETSKEKAVAILAYEPHDKAFAFYLELGKPLNLHAHNLRDFANKIEKVNAMSIQFHMERGDFEAWFNGLGDQELAKKVALLKQRGVTGEELRRQLRQIVMERYRALANLAGQPVYNE